jgi:hypothetical protein
MHLNGCTAAAYVSVRWPASVIPLALQQQDCLRDRPFPAHASAAGYASDTQLLSPLPHPTPDGHNCWLSGCTCLAQNNSRTAATPQLPQCNPFMMHQTSGAFCSISAAVPSTVRLVARSKHAH